MFVYLCCQYDKTKQNTMKVSVTLREVLTYEITQEFELTKAEYNEYINTGNLPIKKDNEIQHELSGNIEDVNWVLTEHEIIDIEKI